MAILNVGLQRFAARHNQDVNEVDWGDSTVPNNVTMTGVQSPITGAEGLSIKKTQSTFSNQFTATLDSVTAVDEEPSEISFGNDTVKYDRTVFPKILHTGNDEVVIIKTYLYERGN